MVDALQAHWFDKFVMVPYNNTSCTTSGLYLYVKEGSLYHYSVTITMPLLSWVLLLAHMYLGDTYDANKCDFVDALFW